MGAERKIDNWVEGLPDLNGLVTDYTMEKLSSAIAEIDMIKKGEQVSNDYLTEKVNDANEWIKFTAGDDEELYELYRFRVFIRNGVASIVQGLPYDTEKGDYV